MKLTTNLILAMVAYLEMTAAVLVPRKIALPGCPDCAPPGCSPDQYDSSTALTEADQVDDGTRSFSIDAGYGGTANLVANFTDIKSSGFPALATIANHYDTDLVLEIDLGTEDDDDEAGVQLLKIAAKTTCVAFLPDNEKADKISNVQAYMDSTD